MEDRFESVARGIGSGKLSRRQALAGLGGALLAFVIPTTARASRCPEGHHRCGSACCGEDEICCKIRGAHFCCPKGELITVGCPTTVLPGCIAV